MRRKIAVFVLVISVSLGAFTSASEAYVPIVAQGVAESFAGSLSVGLGTSFANVEAARLVAQQLISGMDDTTGAEMEQIIDDWEYNGKLTMTEAFYLKMQLQMDTLINQNSLIKEMVSKKIISCDTEKGVNFKYVLSGSLIASGAPNFWDNVLMYQMPNVGTDIFYFNDRIGFKLRYTNNNTSIALNMVLFNPDGTVSSDTYLAAKDMAPIGGARVGFTVSYDGYLSLYVQGYDYFNGQLKRVLNVSAIRLNASEMAYINNSLMGKTADISYTVYNPSVDNRGNVVIPVPYNYPIGSLPGVLPGDIHAGVETPVETGKDYTGILGAISGAIAGIKAWTDTWSNADSTNWNLDLSGLQVNLFDRFPFCLPFDFMHIVDVFAAQPSDYVFRIKLDAQHLQFDHTVDMSPFMMPIRFFRYVAVIWFIYILVSKTRSLIKW